MHHKFPSTATFVDILVSDLENGIEAGVVAIQSIYYNKGDSFLFWWWISVQWPVWNAVKIHNPKRLVMLLRLYVWHP